MSHLFQCSLYPNERLVLLNVTQGIDNSILELGGSHIVKILHHEKNDTNILHAII